MDKTDEKILDLLKGNARISFQELGDALGMSRVAAVKRVKKLEDAGIIRGYNTAIYREDEVTMLIDIETTPEAFGDVLDYVGTRTIDIRQIFITTGENHIHAVAASSSVKNLRYMEKMIAKHCGEGIVHMTCHAVKAIIKDVYGGVTFGEEVDSMEDIARQVLHVTEDPDFTDWFCEKYEKGGFKIIVTVGPKARESSIEDLNLSVRAYNCLRRAGFETVSELMEGINGRDDLMKIRNLGKKSVEEIMLKLFLFTYENLEPKKRKAYLERVKNLNSGELE